MRVILLNNPHRFALTNGSRCLPKCLWRKHFHKNTSKPLGIHKLEPMLKPTYLQECLFAFEHKDSPDKKHWKECYWSFEPAHSEDWIEIALRNPRELTLGKWNLRNKNELFMIFMLLKDCCSDLLFLSYRANFLTHSHSGKFLVYFFLKRSVISTLKYPIGCVLDE